MCPDDQDFGPSLGAFCGHGTSSNNLSAHERLLSRVMAQKAQSSIWGKAVIPQGITLYGKTHGAAESSHARQAPEEVLRRASCGHAQRARVHFFDASHG